MPTLTIDLPEAEYRAAISLPTNEQRRVLSLAANRYATARNKATQDDSPPTEEDLLAIGEGIAALDAGRTVSSDVFFARLEEKYGWALQTAMSHRYLNLRPGALAVHRRMKREQSGG